MFPLGIAYFVFLIVTIATGGSMIWTFVGPVILLATLFISRWLGDLEAITTGYVNGTTIRRPPSGLEGVSNFRSQIKVRLIDPTTYTGLLYLFVQFPVGIAAFIGLIVVYAFVGGAIFSPLGVAITDSGPFWDFGIKLTAPWVWSIDLNEFPGSLIPIPLGLIGLVLASHLVLAFSSLHGWWARLMLGSRSNRVSSRPVPTPAGDEPPKPTAVAEPELAAVESTSETAAGTPENNPEPEVQSAAAASVSTSTPPPAQFVSPSAPAPAVLTPVPDPPPPDFEPEIILDTSAIEDLTAREQEVFMLMAHGDTNADIAEELFISEGTVKTHVKRVFSKLYMRDRTQVVVFAYEKGLVTPGGVAQQKELQASRSYGG